MVKRINGQGSVVLEVFESDWQIVYALSDFQDTLALHMRSKPGKFQMWGKSRHWRGLTELMRQRFWASRKMQDRSGRSVRESAVRLRVKRVYWSRKALMSSPRCSAMASASPSFRITYPGCRQQAPHCVHSYVGLLFVFCMIGRCACFHNYRILYRQTKEKGKGKR